MICQWTLACMYFTVHATDNQIYINIHMYVNICLYLAK
jgi:hypothetical protein